MEFHQLFDTAAPSPVVVTATRTSRAETGLRRWMFDLFHQGLCNTGRHFPYVVAVAVDRFLQVLGPAGSRLGEAPPTEGLDELPGWRNLRSLLDRRQVAVIVCDMWDDHHCKIAAQRVGVMAPRMNQVLTAARDRAELTPAVQVLVYPMLDDRTVTRHDPHPYVVHEAWSAEYNAFGWRSLLAAEPGSPGVSPYAAAARAEDLSGLAPAFISVGALDLFLEEDMEYASRLIRAGVPVELHVYPGAFHGFNFMEEARVSVVAEADGLRALHKAFHG